MHPSTAQLLRWFDCAHLPEFLQVVVMPFADLANAIASSCDGPEATAGLRKLLEAKDCIVRATIATREVNARG